MYRKSQDLSPLTGPTCLGLLLIRMESWPVGANFKKWIKKRHQIERNLEFETRCPPCPPSPKGNTGEVREDTNIQKELRGTHSKMRLSRKNEGWRRGDHCVPQNPGAGHTVGW